MVHGDIKSANVLVSDTFYALICNFLLSRSADIAMSTAVHGTGSTRWMSPEPLERRMTVARYPPRGAASFV